jgi:hypothetical protein
MAQPEADVLSPSICTTLGQPASVLNLQGDWRLNTQWATYATAGRRQEGLA